MPDSKSKVTIVDVDKTENLAQKILDKINEHLLQEDMTAPEVVLALQTVAYHVMQAKEEFEQEQEKTGIQRLAA